MRGNVTILTLLLLSTIPLLGNTLTNPDAINRRVVAPDQAAPNNKFITPVNTFKFRARGGVDLTTTFTIDTPGSYYLVEDIGYQGRSFHASTNTEGTGCAIFVNSDNVVIDLGNYTLYNNSGAVTTSLQKGIDIAGGKHNVVIRNGNIASFQDTGIYVRTNCTDIRLQNLTITKCIKNGINFDGGADTSATTQNMITNCIVENSMIGRSVGLTGTDAVGLRMDNCYNIFINDSTFNRCNTGSVQTIDAYGVLVSSCTNIIFTNCDASGNHAKNAYGFYLGGAANSDSCNACSFINCTANGNWGNNSTLDGFGYGFFAQNVNGCLWERCFASSNEGSRFGCGFSYATAKYCKTSHCESLYSRGNSKAQSETQGAHGFNSLSGEGNIWDCCEAAGAQVALSAAIDAECVGFDLASETNSMLKGCTSRNNNSVSNGAWGIGIKLTNVTRCIVDNCSITGNKSATTNHGLGLRDTNTESSTTLITRSFFFNNGDTTSTAQNVHLSYYLGGELNITTTVNQGNMKSLTGINPYENVSMSYV